MVVTGMQEALEAIIDGHVLVMEFPTAVAALNSINLLIASANEFKIAIDAQILQLSDDDSKYQATVKLSITD